MVTVIGVPAILLVSLPFAIRSNSPQTGAHAPTRPTATPPRAPATSTPITLSCLNCLDYGHPADITVTITTILVTGPTAVELTYRFSNSTPHPWTD